MNCFRSAAAVLLTLALGLSPLLHAQEPVFGSAPRIVGFGDSLSDPGNFFALTGQQSLAPYKPVPSAPYAIGGHHFSNGEPWLEQLAQLLNTPRSGKPAFQANEAFSNYAIGGARARPGGLVPDLTTQVGAYLSANGWTAEQNALYSVWFGSNDARDVLGLLEEAETEAEQYAALALINQATETIRSNITALHGAGARVFLVANLPNLGITPAARSGGPAATATASLVAAIFNGELEAVLSDLEVLPDIQILRLDIWTLLNGIYASPESYGLTDVMQPCLSFLVADDAVCDNPSQHLFWDAIHPTRKTHTILANAAFGLLVSP